MISSYDQPSNTEQIARSRTRRRRAARPMRICVPGGIWVYDFIQFLVASQDQAFAVHQLRIENRGSRRAPNRVMAEKPEFVIENRTRTHGSDDDCHSLTSIAVQTWLRPLNVSFQKHDGPRCRRQLQLVDWRGELTERSFHFFSRDSLL